MSTRDWFSICFSGSVQAWTLTHQQVFTRALPTFLFCEFSDLSPAISGHFRSLAAFTDVLYNLVTTLSPSVTRSYLTGPHVTYRTLSLYFNLRQINHLFEHLREVFWSRGMMTTTALNPEDRHGFEPQLRADRQGLHRPVLPALRWPSSAPSTGQPLQRELNAQILISSRFVRTWFYCTL